MKISDYMRENFICNHNKKNNIDEITNRMNILSLINEEKLVLSKTIQILAALFKPQF